MILDTNVLVYCVGQDHPLRAPARRLVLAIEEGLLEATTSVLVIQEFTYVYARRRSVAEAVSLARNWTALLAPLVDVRSDDIDLALTLVERASLKPSDALIATAALRTGRSLVSADRDLVAVANLDVVYPDDDGIRSLLAGTPGGGTA